MTDHRDADHRRRQQPWGNADRRIGTSWMKVRPHPMAESLRSIDEAIAIVDAP